MLPVSFHILFALLLETSQASTLSSHDTLSSYLGMQPEPTYDNLVPFIGVIDQRGVAYETKAIASGLGQFLLTETLQTSARDRGYKFTKEEALNILRDCIKVMFHRDCCAVGEYDLSTVDAKGTELMKAEKSPGNWEIANYSCHFSNHHA